MNWEFHMSKVDLEKAEEPEIKFLSFIGSQRKQGNSRKKYIILFHWLHLSFWLGGSQQTGKFLKRWEYRPPYLSPEKPVSAQEAIVRTGRGTTDWFTIGKGVWQGCLLAPCLFYLYAEYIMQNDGLHESQARLRLLRKLSTTSDMQMIPFWRNWRGTREPFDNGESGEWKSWLKTQHSENKDHGIWSHYFMANRWGKGGKSDIFYFPGSKITADSDCNHEFKRCLLIGSKAMTNLVKSGDITLLTKSIYSKLWFFQ